MNLVLDMNLSPDWVAVLENAGWKTVHWFSVGNPRATDSEVMAWARTNGYVARTHDLNFGTSLALTQSESPSVFQLRTQDLTPATIGNLVITALRQFESELEQGALVMVDRANLRARILPLKRTAT